MKRLRFETLSLISHVEKAAISIRFHPRLTVITGENDTGKSSLIKSIYWMFGAESARMHKRWLAAAVSGLMSFTVDNQRYYILRHRKTYSIFDANGSVIFSGQGVTKDLGPFLSNLLDFKLILTSRQGVGEIPPPAFAFLPFYVDQDVGWVDAFQSFASLQQYPDFRRDVILYHTGIRPNEYYDLRAQQKALDREREASISQRDVVQAAVDKIKSTEASFGIELDPGQFEADLTRLLQQLHSLRGQREKLSERISDLVARRVLLDHELAIARRALSELDKDYVWLAKEPAEDILCPTCGTVHEASFVQRFGIAQDRELCRDFVIETHEKIVQVAEQIGKERVHLAELESNLGSVTAILNAKRGEVQLREVLQSEGRRHASNILKEEVALHSEKIYALDTKLKKLADDLTAFTDGERRNQIEKFYFESMTSNLATLNVKTLRLTDVEKIDAKVRDTGSDQPRAILSYNIAIFNTIVRYSSALVAPLVVDSPIQQDQDSINAKAMLDLLFSSVNSSAQLIVGTVSLNGAVLPHGTEIEFTEKLKLLQTANFEATSAEFAPFLTRAASF